MKDVQGVTVCPTALCSAECDCRVSEYSRHLITIEPHTTHTFPFSDYCSTDKQNKVHAVSSYGQNFAALLVQSLSGLTIFTKLRAARPTGSSVLIRGIKSSFYRPSIHLLGGYRGTNVEARDCHLTAKCA